ncbi:DUF742 domain-containing protein [Streptomyces scabiei]|uniref:DUF742 domain-containing protein n=1 Tax=Streptomyces scabiei TaxID=1930 RepID=UPI0029B8C539|nr:DUF742 domain-containing protein [Streptomyces scabiei]MDX2531553.1 DUF742 domain-containing protein [Streptomyces scabiei]MDX2796611.1 DUF742 domain-containing protein [Streptomyces scabiei]MDX2862442.1 DUF742 domain-containing protein [Streptomyces scabiei]MDX3824601.1 DUF742 domain-containing protein [Streptomyces scabiei]
MTPLGHGGDPLVRTYVVTGGRTTASRNHFDAVLLVALSPSSAQLSRAQLNPEQHAILGLLAYSAESVAELSALLHLPMSVVRILLADLMETGHITTGGRIYDAATPDRKLLEAVLEGLERL